MNIITDEAVLSPKEVQLLLLLYQGLTNDAISHRMKVKAKTVNVYYNGICQNFDWHPDQNRRVCLALWVHQHLELLNILTSHG